MIQGTDKTEEGTQKGYNRINLVKNTDNSLKDKPIVFVDDNGVIHADINNITAARKASLLPKKKDVDEGKGASTGPVLTSEGMIEYTMNLPPLAFALCDMAKTFGLIKDKEMTFDEWVYECIERRFTCDYNLEIVLQPIAEKKGLQAMIRKTVQAEMAKVVVAESSEKETSEEEAKK
jgi:hypothetical protein